MINYINNLVIKLVEKSLIENNSLQVKHKDSINLKIMNKMTKMDLNSVLILRNKNEKTLFIILYYLIFVFVITQIKKKLLDQFVLF
jgi:hypothetical protein